MATLDAAWTKIRAQQHSQVPNIQKPALLLVAIEQTLGDQNRSPGAYWVALLSTLTQLAQDPQAATPGDKRQLLEAALYLAATLVPFLDPPQLRAKLDTLHALPPLLASFAAHAPALKSLVALAQHLVVAAPAQTLERDRDGCRAVYATLLSLCADARPKVRRRAQDAVHAVLANPPPPATVHPYALESAVWICDKLDDALRAAKRGGKKDAAHAGAAAEHGADESRAIALLTFVRNLGASWPSSATATLLPLLLSTLTLSSQHLTLSALTLLSHLFSAAHAAESLSADHVKRTLEALVDARPKVAEGTEQGEKLLAGWVEGVGEGMVALARSDADAALGRLATLFPSTLGLLAAASTPALRLAVETACTLMIRHCIPDAEILAAGATVKGVIEHVERALTSARYAAQSQPHVLALVKALFLRLRVRDSANGGKPAAARLLTKALVLVGKAREDSRFEWKKEADAVLDAAIKVLGPETVLEYLPLNLAPEQGASPAKARAWLLPLLKPGITNTRLGHFRDTFVPLSASFFNKVEDAKAGGRDMEAKVWDTLVGQTWALLPGYCEYPIDLVDAFDTDFVSLLANVVYTQPALRPSVFKALSTLLSTTLTLANSSSPPDLLRDQFGLTPADGRASLKHLESLAQTILSVAFNVYGKMSRGEGGYVLEAVGAWLAILPASELEATYDRVSKLALQALEAASTTPHAKDDATLPASHALVDILVTLVPHCRAQLARSLFDFALQDAVLASGDAAVQKKGYRILARLCEVDGMAVLQGREGDVIDRVVEGAEKVANGAKRDRVSLLAALIPLIPADSLHIVPSLIPEAVLSTKESNGVTREAAYALLVSMGEKMRAGGRIKRHLIKGMEDSMEDEVDASEEEFVTMLSAGLAATSPHMIAATIGALGRLVWEFHDTLKDSYLSELVDTIVVFLTSANREIVKAGLGFVKVAVVTLPAALVTPSLPAMVPALVNWSHEHSNHFKVKIRHLLERMIRKYGYDDVERYVPEDDKKLVNNIRKRQARSRKKKAAAMDVDGEQDEDDEAPKPQAAQRSAYDEVLYGSDSDVSAASDDEQEGPVRHAPTGVKNRKSQMRKAKKDEREGGGAYIQEGENEVLDLLDDRMMSRISAAKPAAASTSRKPLDSHFKTDDSGKYRFEEPDSDKEDGPAAAPARAGGAGMGDYIEAMHGEDGHTRDAKGKIRFNKSQGKRGRGNDDDFDLEGDVDRDVPVTAGLKELEVSRKKKKQRKEVERIGGDFKAKRAGGDVKKDGMQPYAFVPLQQVAGKKSNQRGPKLGITGLKRAGKK
ncbi:mRNA-binding protein RRP12 [Rhodotorula paludigena]|uniref:mRNA-binding protein RRP12 n=1 Tax=Rhodotorula paludigena TaxID=86838 RepID=UPI003178FA3F